MKDLNEQIFRLGKREEELTSYEKDQLEKFQEARSKIIEVMTEKNMFKCKVRWRQCAERPTKYFHGLMKRWRYDNRCHSMFMTNLKRDPGQLSSDKDDMLRECHAFYGQLYQSREVECNADGMFFKNLPKITEEQMLECDKPIDTEELGGILFGTKGGTSPGPSGFIVEFYKVF